MDKASIRIQREQKTLTAMIRIYCRKCHHHRRGLCFSCAQLLHYATGRLYGCPYRENKPTCALCPIHCYKADKRAEIKQVMKFSGPRMLTNHPILAFYHLLHTHRSERKKTMDRRSDLS